MLKYNCKIHGEVKAHSSGKYPRCSICNTKRMRDKHQALRAKAVELGGGCCQKCGYDKCRNALEFHHLDPSKKDFEISRKYNKSWEAVKAEIAKCILVCANCHREIHAGLV